MKNRSLYQQLMCISLLWLLVACNAPNSELTPKLQHALLTEPQSELIAQGLARLMHSDAIAVDNDVFMQRSLLVTDAMEQRDGHGNPIMGKQLNRPDRFELLIKKNLCFLRHLDSKATEPLPNVKCKLNQ
ncbi:hypothetical protein [Pseudoalteromonas sp.]|uniref:hypothetical protein n=1 Tax=Pseudoalteromonas sp. TaxID=53249 RepID=UPI00262FFD26|nr:hypothetical protein [Pseudoalteromonas sp.]